MLKTYYFVKSFQSFLSTGATNVQNATQMALEWLFCEKTTKVAKWLGIN